MMDVRLEKLWAEHEIQNLMGRLMYLYEAGEYEEMLSHFAVQTEGVTAQAANHGKRTTPEGIHDLMVDFWTRLFKGHETAMRTLYPEDENPTGRNGLLDLRCLGTQVLEVADDLRTAKGLWSAPTVSTECRVGAEMPSAQLVWLKFALDFVCEDGEWRVWHYHSMPMFNTPYEKSWVQSSLEAEQPRPNSPARPQPQGEVTSYHPYSVHTAPVLEPLPPEPYRTFAETFSY